MSRPDDAATELPDLFAGQKLWFSHAVPQRKWLIQNAQRYGATVVNNDIDADVRLVDHTKKNNFPGTTSYKYVEQSIRNGTLEDLASHAVGASSRVSRVVGSTVTAPKSGRTPFTAEDDQFLWDWVKPFVDKGGAGRGNEIYKQLEEANPRHTFQSWRDRWHKYVQYQTHRQVTAQTVAVEEEIVETPASVARPTQPPLLRKRRREANDDGEPQRVQGSRRAEGAKQQHGGRSPVRPTPEMLTDTEEGGELVSASVTHETPQADNHGNNNAPVSSRKEGGNRSKTFTRVDYGKAYHIISLFMAWKEGGKELRDFEQPWELFAEQNNNHTASEWKEYCMARVIPDFCREQNLEISEVAPYVVGDQGGNENGGALGVVDIQEGREPSSDTSSSQEELKCTNCYTTDTKKWRFDAGGNRVCYGCHKFFKLNGRHRRSTAWQDTNAGDEDEVGQTGIDDQASLVLPDDNSAAQSIPTPSSSRRSRGTQAFTSLLVGTALTSGAADVEAVAESQRTRSPSFRPESPTFARPPLTERCPCRVLDSGSQARGFDFDNLRLYVGCFQRD